jgi:hypothetical protein
VTDEQMRLGTKLIAEALDEAKRDARNAGLEEAAMVVEGYSWGALGNVAADIRSRKSPVPTP